MYGDHAGEKFRFTSQITRLPNLKPLPSVGDWIMVEAKDPSTLARKVCRRLWPGAVKVPRETDGLVRIPIGEPKDNDKVIEVLRDVTKPPRKRYVS